MIKVTINLLDIKPGTLLIYKNHSLIKELFYKLLKKETSFNRIEVIPEECTISQFEDADNMLILNPKRLYSKAEIKTLKNYFENNYIDPKKVSTVIKAINTVRPDTFPENASIDDIINSTYYKKVNVEKDSTKICY